MYINRIKKKQLCDYQLVYSIYNILFQIKKKFDIRHLKKTGVIQVPTFSNIEVLYIQYNVYILKFISFT